MNRKSLGNPKKKLGVQLPPPTHHSGKTRRRTEGFDNPRYSFLGLQGQGDVPKKGGHGKGAWGSLNEEMRDAVEAYQEGTEYYSGNREQPQANPVTQNKQ